MADLTLKAVDGLLSLLVSAIKDEGKVLLCNDVQGDIQFIKDEMDSMIGFLLHLNKTETEHNDQHRAWMRQVREVAYIAEDYINEYMRELAPPPPGRTTCCGASVQCTTLRPKTMYRRYRLAKKISKLKGRVREVGERRLRYGVSVPDAKPKPEPPGAVGEGSQADEDREKFLRALEEEEEGHGDDHGAPSPSSFSTAISLLPGDLPTEAGEEVREILKTTCCAPRHVHGIKMLLRALYAYPHVTKEELTSLKSKLQGRAAAADVSKELMLVSYSKLSMHYKSCLHYLTAFLEEDSISRTSLVRRWVAEGFVVVGDEGRESLEEAGERCFDELVFRGFVRPAPRAPTRPGVRIKSCDMEKSVRHFVVGISKTENFLAESLPSLPEHYRNQLEIRKIARRQPPQQQHQQQPQRRRTCSWNICPRNQLLLNDDRTAAAGGDKLRLHPMDEMVRLLEKLPKYYRLNVLDLGGCRGLKNSHLKSFCKVVSLKYLCLRNTDASSLPKEINKLRELETLDIRQTAIPAGATAIIDIPKLKRLLADIRGSPAAGHEAAVQMPKRIGAGMEILRHVQILHGGKQRQPLNNAVGHLKRLRKLGVVLENSEEGINDLLRTITNLNECLHSLSVCITPLSSSSSSSKTDDNAVVASAITLEDKEAAAAGGGSAAVLSPAPKNLESLNIKYFRGSTTSGSLPRWIKGLGRLSKITLRETQLARESLQTLGKLEGLRCLRLHRGSYVESNINLEKGEFPKLRLLLIDQVDPIMRISVQKDAAPRLQKIGWTFDKKMEVMADTVEGISNLPSLEELELNGSWNDEGRHVEKALAAHPKPPRLRSQGEVIAYSDTLARREVSATRKLARLLFRIAAFPERLG